MRILIGAVAVMLLAGCLAEGKRSEGLVNATKQIEDLPLATNSPDATVKSWWAAKDAEMRLDLELCFEYANLQRPAIEKLSQLASSNVSEGRKCRAEPLLFDRQIAKVEVESETRATVYALIKNITSPEPGSTLDESDRRSKEAGERYRYTLERKDSSSGWGISKVSNLPSYAKDWQDAYIKTVPSNNRYVYGMLQ